MDSIGLAISSNYRHTMPRNPEKLIGRREREEKKHHQPKN